MVAARAGRLLRWLIIPAAFIGPGTVTTAAQAGASYGPVLLWSVTFSTLACWLLQEGAARLAILGGHPLAEALAQRYGRALRWAAAGIIGFGCAAYQAGNLLGASAGLELAFGAGRRAAALVLALLAALLLWNGRIQRTSQLLGALVAVMAAAFCITGLRAARHAGGLWAAAVLPQAPEGSELLIVSLIGTAIVPYNLFLGSRLGQESSLRSMRAGLAVSVGLGGLITAMILLAGTAVQGGFSFEAVAAAMRRELGPAGGVLFGAGLFAAGFTSAITAPYAAALTAAGLLGAPDSSRWQPGGPAFRLVWLLVLCTGAAFAAADIRPVPAIILAQGLNGLLLPLAAALLILLLSRMPRHAHTPLLNALMILVFGIIAWLGCLQSARALLQALALPPPGAGTLLRAAALPALLLTAWLALRVRRLTQPGSPALRMGPGPTD